MRGIHTTADKKSPQGDDEEEEDGVKDEDDVAVYRTPGQLRTIFGSNADSKILATGLADILTEPTLALTLGIQRGSCRGRQLALNVVDLDSYMRAFNTISSFSLPSQNTTQIVIGKSGSSVKNRDLPIGLRMGI